MNFTIRAVVLGSHCINALIACHIPSPQAHPLLLMSRLHVLKYASADLLPFICNMAKTYKLTHTHKYTHAETQTLRIKKRKSQRNEIRLWICYDRWQTSIHANRAAPLFKTTTRFHLCTQHTTCNSPRKHLHLRTRNAITHACQLLRQICSADAINFQYTILRENVYAPFSLSVSLFLYFVLWLLVLLSLLSYCMDDCIVNCALFAHMEHTSYAINLCWPCSFIKNYTLTLTWIRFKWMNIILSINCY